MVRRFTCTTLAVALGLMAGACSEQPAPTATDEGVAFASGPLLNTYTNGPLFLEQAEIFRFDDTWFIRTNDFSQGLAARHYEGWRWRLCSDPQGVVWHEQIKGDIFTFVGEALRYVQQVRDAPVTIYPIVDDPPWVPLFDENGDPIPGQVAIFCDHLANDWLYFGTHNLTWTDSDISGGDDTPGANTWGWTANGKVQDRDGNWYRYHEQSRFLFIAENCVPPDFKNCFKELKEEITVR